MSQASIERVAHPSRTSYAAGLRCDASPASGVGHLVRCLALGDEIRSRGGRVVVLGDVGVAWVRDLVDARGIPVAPAPSDPGALAATATSLGLDAVVLDGYALDPGCGAALRGAGLAVLSLVDGEFGRGQAADVYLDQNLGGTPPLGTTPGAEHLAGLGHTLLRDEVLRHRPAPGAAPVRREGTPRLLAVFGGTDPYAAAPVLAGLALATGRDVEVVAVAADPARAEALAALPAGPGQSVTVLPTVPDLAALAVTCDAAVTAAGSSVWELLALGVPTAVVRVVDNQELGYSTTTGQGVADPGGRLDDLRSDEDARAATVAVLARLLSDAEHRAALAAAGPRLVDGRGRERVVDALERAVGRARVRRGPGAAVTGH